MLQSHLLRDHFREKIEKLPKNDPFACPEKGCPKAAFKTFDGLFTHYYTHINLEKFVERNSGQQVITSKSNINWEKIQQLQKSNNLHLAKNDQHKKYSSLKILKPEKEKCQPAKPILPPCIDVTVNGQPWKMRDSLKPNITKKGTQKKNFDPKARLLRSEEFKKNFKRI